eukprot:5703049-Prymnesium_polylepis.1
MDARQRAGAAGRGTRARRCAAQEQTRFRREGILGKARRDGVRPRTPLAMVESRLRPNAHGMHYEGNVLLDKTVQLPLAASEDLDPAAKADVLQATEAINTLWRGYNFPKYIKFGKDGS